jgi:hypothetical protein
MLIGVSAFSQKYIEKLSFQDAKNSSITNKIRFNTTIGTYTAQDGTVLKKGDTLMIGIPSSSGTTISDKSYGYGTKSNTRSEFQTITIGKPGGFGNVMMAMDGNAPNRAGLSLQGQSVVIEEILATHIASSKKSPLQINMTLASHTGGAIAGVNKKLTVQGYEKAVFMGEIRSINAPITREQAIEKLKEAKVLFDLELINEEEFNLIRDELKIIIMKN